MSTLLVMKNRIVDEMSRADLAGTSLITNAISDAIAFYSTERFWFNESRDITFPTVAAQEFYTSSDNANIPDLYAIDYLGVLVGAQMEMLAREQPEVIESLANTQPATGQPMAYTYYQQKIRFYPIPSGVYTVRIGAHIKKAAPASDSETANVWMVEAERLIRARAKYELALHAISDDELATRCKIAEKDAYDQLKGRTNKQVSTGRITSMRF